MKSKNRWLYTLILLAVFFSSCSDDPAESSADQAGILARVGRTRISVSDFNTAVELSAIAYGDARSSHGRLTEIRRDTLRQLIEEAVLREKANDLGLTVSEAERRSAVEGIMAEYPDDSFERMLVKNAVSRRVWEARLESRLLMDKVIQSELADRISVTPAELAAAFTEHHRSFESPEPDTRAIDARLVARIRREKTEAAYQRWLQQAMQTVRVEIDDIIWEKISES